MIQNQLLNYVLDTKDSSIITENGLDVSFFCDYTNEYNYIKNHLNQYGKVPDKATFLGEFSDFDVLQVDEPPAYLVSEIYKDKNKRQMASTFNKVRELICADKIDEALHVYTTNVDKAVSNVGLSCVDILKDTSRYEDYVERCNDFQKFYVKTGFKELDEVIGGWDRHEELATIVARPGTGKCLEKGTLVRMADGTSKKVEDIRVGDRVQSLNRVNTVVALHHGISGGYKITPNNGGGTFTVSENHILTLMRLKTHWDATHKMSTTRNEFELVDMTVEDYLKLPKSQRRRYQLYRPAIDYSSKELLIPPYILGLWLGDGTTSRVELTTMDVELEREWRRYAASKDLRVSVSHTTKSNKAYMYRIVGRRGKSNSATKDFIHYSLINNKHIPLEYLTGDREQRLSLLAGIIDTDGYYNGHGFELRLSSKSLLEEVCQLCVSLGIRADAIKEHWNSQYKCKFFTACFYGPYLNDIPVHLTRHKVNVSPMHAFNLTGFAIERVPQIEYYGFMADGDHRYILANGILTHNTWVLSRCALAAAEQGLNVGLYSGEMSSRKVGYRIDTLYSHISNTCISKGNSSVQNTYKDLLDNKLKDIKGSIKVLTPQHIGGLAGVTTLRAFIEKYNLDILFIDQHSLLEDDRKAKNPVEKAANISKDLKQLQVLKQIPIIAVSQQNRTSTEDGIGTEHIAQSDRISQDSTVILALEKEDKTLTVHLVKSRDSENGKKLKYLVDFDKGTFHYIPESADGEDTEETEELRRIYEEDTESEDNPF